MCSCLKTAGTIQERFNIELLVSTHSRPKAAGPYSQMQTARVIFVSTHSRSKAVGCCVCPRSLGERGFNTQPPEGGWAPVRAMRHRFQVSTHNRPKAAGISSYQRPCVQDVSTHSRLKAAGHGGRRRADAMGVSTHSRLKAAGVANQTLEVGGFVSTHSRLKAAGALTRSNSPTMWFQHTAA